MSDGHIPPPTTGEPVDALHRWIDQEMSTARLRAAELFESQIRAEVQRERERTNRERGIIR